nr:immunoglobulin light chain junction region [Macaca mulatta]
DYYCQVYDSSAKVF